jgi:hypothetical protein
MDVIDQQSQLRESCPGQLLRIENALAEATGGGEELVP